MNKRTTELSKAGINISLTGEGCNLLAKIMADGCPVKSKCGNFEHITCPYVNVATKFNCETCWKKWLKDFIKEDL